MQGAVVKEFPKRLIQQLIHLRVWGMIKLHY